MSDPLGKLMSKARAPIALFVFNRPVHTSKTIEALKASELSCESDLIIFSDGPRNEQDKPLVAEVRKCVADVKGFKSVKIVCRDRNFGLANSISSSVNSILRDHISVIVVEDDILVAPSFLRYMNEALNIYENDERVMHISGYMPPITPGVNWPNTFFYRATTCWGWATWRRSWKFFNPNASALLQRIKTSKKIKEFNIDETQNYFADLNAQALGLRDSWAICWYASVFLNQGLCLHPKVSMVNNVGFDGSGIHCNMDSNFSITQLSKEPLVFERLDIVEESNLVVSEIKKFNLRMNPNVLIRVLNKIKRLIYK